MPVRLPEAPQADPAQTGIGCAVLEWVSTCGDVPSPGRGRTGERLRRLAAVSSTDLSVGRLAEGHVDAIAILEEAGRSGLPGNTYGVWAARSATDDVAATRRGGAWVLSGQKPFCSGAGIVSRALVVAGTPEGSRLFDVDLRHDGIGIVPHSWPAVGMAGSNSGTVTFDNVEVAEASVVGGVEFYTSRIGFWWGAVGVAACWWGGARGLVTTVGEQLTGADIGDHEAAAYGRAIARCQAMSQTLAWAGRRIDASHGSIPSAAVAEARRTALITREIVHSGAMEILSLVAAAGGARPICLDAGQSRRSADLYAYLAQYHPGRDAAALGRHALADH